MYRYVVFLFFSLLLIPTSQAQNTVGVAPSLTFNFSEDNSMNVDGGVDVMNMRNGKYGWGVSGYFDPTPFDSVEEIQDDSSVDVSGWYADFLTGPAFVFNKRDKTYAFFQVEGGLRVTHASAEVNIFGFHGEGDDTSYTPAVGLSMGSFGHSFPVYMNMGVNYYISTNEASDGIVKGTFAFGFTF